MYVFTLQILNFIDNTKEIDEFLIIFEDIFSTSLRIYCENFILPRQVKVEDSIAAAICYDYELIPGKKIKNIIIFSKFLIKIRT